MSEESMWDKFPDRITAIKENILAEEVVSVGLATEDGQLQAEYVLNKVSRLRISRILEDVS